MASYFFGACAQASSPSKAGTMMLSDSPHEISHAPRERETERGKTVTVVDGNLGVHLPLKIKIFLWLICNDRIQSAEQLVKRNWPGDSS